MTKRILVLLIACLSLFIAACGDDDDGGGGGGSDSADVQTLRPGTLTVGSDIPYPPFEQGRAPDYEGFDIELVNAIADKLGLETQIKDTPFDTIFRDLSQDKFDAVISGSTITDDREKVIDFGDPYFLAEQSILTKADSDIQTTDDLAGKTVGVQKGTTGESYVKDKVDAGSVRSYGEVDDAFNALVAGQVDAVVFDLPGTQQAVKDLEGLAVRQSIDTGEEFGIAFQEDNDALREAANKALAELKDDGTFAELYKKWFKKEPPKEILSSKHEPS